MDPWIPAAFTGGLAGAIVSAIINWTMKHFDDKKKNKAEFRSLLSSIVQDIDGLIDSFESLYADASDDFGSTLAKRLRVFKYIEPTSFANRYKLRSELNPDSFRRLETIPYTLRELRQANEVLIIDPPEEPASDHWESVQSFLVDLNEVKQLLAKVA